MAVSVRVLPQAVYVSAMTEGGAAERDGKLRVGDRVISVSVWEWYSHLGECVGVVEPSR